MGMLDGKVAIVTGAGSGIGRESALAFAREGAKVVVADMTDGIYETVSKIEEAGGAATPVKCDVTKESEVEGLVAAAIDTYGRLDCAHNNAGIVGAQGVLTADNEESDFDKVIAVNLKGVFLCMKHEIPAMLKAGGGSIVNTASASGLIATPGAIAYSASKFAVNGMTKTVAAEYGAQGIRVNSVCPGYIETPMTAQFLETEEGQSQVRALAPMGRWGQPAEVANVVVWLCSDGASFVTATNMSVDGGLVSI